MVYQSTQFYREHSFYYNFTTIFGTIVTINWRENNMAAPLYNLLLWTLGCYPEDDDPAHPPQPDPIPRIAASATSDRSRSEADTLAGRVSRAESTGEDATDRLERIQAIVSTHLTAGSEFITALPDEMHIIDVPRFESLAAEHLRNSTDDIESLREFSPDATSELREKCRSIRLALTMVATFARAIKHITTVRAFAPIPKTIAFHPLYKPMLALIVNGEKMSTSKVLGRGRYGEVVGRSVGEIQFVTKHSLNDSEAAASTAYQELAIHLAIPTHKNLCRAICADSVENTPPVIYFERAEKELFEILETGSPGTLLPYLPQILEGLHALHTAKIETKLVQRVGIVHNDFKFENMFLTKDGTVLLGDFAFSGYVGQKKRIGSLGTAAPEAVKGEGLQTASDIWSFGILCSAILCQTYPFSEEFIRSILFQDENRIKQGIQTQFEYADKEQLDALDKEGALRAIIKRCLQHNPKKRPTAFELLQDPYFSKSGDVLAAAGGAAAGGGGRSSS